MYTMKDLIDLEELNDRELQEELSKASEHYDYIQSLYQGENDANPFSSKLNLQVIFMHLKNTEMYIRRIENLLNEYEIERVFIKKAVTRRNKKLSRLR